MSHLYKRGEVWYVKYYQNGQPRYRSLGTESRKKARAIQREIDRRLDAGILPIPDKGKNPLLDEFWQLYLEWAESHKRPNTIYTERIFWNQLVTHTKIQKLGDLTPKLIERFKKKRFEKDGVSRLSINDCLKHLQGELQSNKQRRILKPSGAALLKRHPPHFYAAV